MNLNRRDFVVLAGIRGTNRTDLDTLQKSRRFHLGGRQVCCDGIIDRGVDGAPFVVLLHTSMPSILVEVSFMSNPRDEKRLQNPAYQRSLAQGIFRGLHKYLQTAVVAVQ